MRVCLCSKNWQVYRSLSHTRVHRYLQSTPICSEIVVKYFEAFSFIKFPYVHGVCLMERIVKLSPTKEKNAELPK